MIFKEFNLASLDEKADCNLMDFIHLDQEYLEPQYCSQGEYI